MPLSMGTGTPTIFPINYAVEFVPWLMNLIGQAQAQAYQIMWNATIPVLLQNWVEIAVFLFLLLLYATILAVTTRRWKTLGRVLYSYFHLGILFVIGLIWGPQIYANVSFELINFVIYAFSFTVVGIIIDNSGLRRRW